MSFDSFFNLQDFLWDPESRKTLIFMEVYQRIAGKLDNASMVAELLKHEFREISQVVFENIAILGTQLALKRRETFLDMCFREYFFINLQVRWLIKLSEHNGRTESSKTAEIFWNRKFDEQNRRKIKNIWNMLKGIGKLIEFGGHTFSVFWWFVYLSCSIHLTI